MIIPFTDQNIRFTIRLFIFLGAATSGLCLAATAVLHTVFGLKITTFQIALFSSPIIIAMAATLARTTLSILPKATVFPNSSATNLYHSLVDALVGVSSSPDNSYFRVVIAPNGKTVVIPRTGWHMPSSLSRNYYTIIQPLSSHADTYIHDGANIGQNAIAAIKSAVTKHPFQIHPALPKAARDSRSPGKEIGDTPSLLLAESIADAQETAIVFDIVQSQESFS